LRPAFGCGDGGEALAGARLSDHHDDALATGEQAADHLALVGLQGRPGRDHPGGDQLAGLAAGLLRHLFGRLQRFALKLPDARGRVAGAFDGLGHGDHRPGSEEGIGGALDLMAGGTVGKQVGNRLDRVAAVEVGGVGRHLAVELRQRQLGGKLDLLAHRRRDGVAVQADLLGFG
jgi:hypothetical protein